jgi:hypothetical protein
MLIVVRALCAPFSFLSGTVPVDLVHERCAVRLRYNISTGDTVEWNNMTVQAGQTDKTKEDGKDALGRRVCASHAGG